MSRQRCGLLAAWTTAWLAGHASYDDVIDVVTADETHRVVGLPGITGAVPLGWALGTLREQNETRLRLVLPAPGDPRGLPAPGEFSAAAMTTGEAVLGGRLGLVPDAGDGPDSIVTWTAYAVGPACPDPLTVAEADHDLVLELGRAARRLADLDVARWHPEAAELFSARRDDRPRLRLPCRHDPRALGLLERAERLAAVLDLAVADSPGGAVTGHEARARDEALTPLATAVRRARMTAYNAV